MILSLAWHNVWRQPRRTLLSASAIAFTCMILVFLPALQLGSYQAMINASVSVMDGIAQIQHKDYLDSPALRTTFSPTKTLEEQILNTAPDITLVKRCTGFALLSSEERHFGVQILGVDAQKERLISTIPKHIEQGDYLSTPNNPYDFQKKPFELAREHQPSSKIDVSNDDEIVLGKTLAKNLKVHVGEAITLLGTGKDGSLAVDSLRVVGIFASGIPALDRQLAEIPISRFDQTFSMEKNIHAWVLSRRVPANEQRSNEKFS